MTLFRFAPELLLLLLLLLLLRPPDDAEAESLALGFGLLLRLEGLGLASLKRKMEDNTAVPGPALALHQSHTKLSSWAASFSVMVSPMHLGCTHPLQRMPEEHSIMNSSELVGSRQVQ